VGLVPVSASPFALLDNRVDGRLRRGEVGDRDELRPPEVALGSLSFGRPDKDLPLPVFLDQALEALLDSPVEVTLGGEPRLVRHDNVGDRG
jgi:hypothetical protein